MGTWNHAWSASAVYLLPAYVGGVRPTSPGYETCIIAPDFSRSETIHVAVSTVKGVIIVDGTTEALTVTLPEGVEATVRLPGCDETKISGVGTYTITP